MIRNSRPNLLLVTSLVSLVLCAACDPWRVRTKATEARLVEGLNLPDPDTVLNCTRTPGPFCPANFGLSGEARPLALSDEGDSIDRFKSGEEAVMAAFEILRSSASSGRSVLVDPAMNKLIGTYNRGLGWTAAEEQSASRREFSLSEFRALAEKVEEATSTGSWDSLSRLYRMVGARPQNQAAADFLEAYFKAYFRYGKFIALQIDASTVVEDLHRKLRSELPQLTDEQIDEIVAEMLAAAKLKDKAWTIGKIENTGFATRGGQVFQFPSVQVTVTLPNPEPDLPNVDFTVVGADLVRVALHAIFDSHMKVPGVPASTAVKHEPKLLMDFSKDIDPQLVNEGEFARIESRSGMVEAAVGAGVGRLVRGLGFVSMNNESLATLIETAFGVTSRKVAEKVFWCSYACEGDSPRGLAAGEAWPSREEQVTLLGFELEGEATQ